VEGHEEQSQIRTSRPGEHNLTVIDTIELPDDRDAEETTWDAEIRFWTRIIECSI
jgi:hypothetical protein